MAFVEWDIVRTPMVRSSIKSGQCSITNVKGSYKLTINQILSKTLFDNGMLFFAVAEDELTGEIAFLFRKSNGVQLAGKELHEGKNGNLRLNNKEIVGRLFKRLNLDNSKRYIINLSPNKSVRPEVMLFIIQSWEENGSLHQAVQP